MAEETWAMRNTVLGNPGVIHTKEVGVTSQLMTFGLIFNGRYHLKKAFGKKKTQNTHNL